jgi:ATP-dependent DNA ligase
MTGAKQVLLAPNELISPEDHWAAKRFPLWASVKYDGHRCLLHKGEFLTRSMKAHPNLGLAHHLKEIAQWSDELGATFDGELYSHARPFNELQSILRSTEKEIPDDVVFHVFDYMPSNEWGSCKRPFEDRYAILGSIFKDHAEFQHVNQVEQFLVETPKDLTVAYERALKGGFEGLMLRNPFARYKHGRATVKENIIYKLKPFDTLDAKVIEVVQQQRVKDGIRRKLNELGRTARTFKAEDHELVDCAGALVVQDEKGRQFNVGWGRGWDYVKREELWRDRASLVGRWVEVRYMVVGEHELPRMPQLVRFRDDKE